MSTNSSATTKKLCFKNWLALILTRQKMTTLPLILWQNNSKRLKMKKLMKLNRVRRASKLVLAALKTKMMMTMTRTRMSTATTIQKAAMTRMIFMPKEM